MNAQNTVSLLLETIVDDETSSISLRVNFLLSELSKQPVINKDTIVGLLEQRGFSQYQQCDEEITTIVNDLKQKLEKLNASSDLANEKFETPVIAMAVDAKTEVIIADDNSEASISLTPAKGGKDLGLTGLKSALAEAGVTFGIEDQLILDLLQRARESKTGEDIKASVASARQAVAGNDTQFIPLVDTANERILKPQLRADGTIDMRELGNLPIVEAGQIIMRKEIFTLGEPGMDVRGNSIAADPGEDFHYDEAPGSRINPENSLELLAEISGQPNLVPNGMKVDNVIKVKAVDLSTGNLNIDANLLVEGDITEGMKVKCTGDITVGGLIESADVEAEGSVFVGQGIVGHVTHDEHGAEENLTNIVRAGNSINALFASYSQLQAGELIHVDEQMLHCDATSQNSISVGSKKVGRGQITGGITRAVKVIETDLVGSSSGVLTRFDLSGPYQQQMQSIVEIKHQINEKYKQANSLSGSLKKLENQNLSGDGQLQMKKIKNTIAQFKKTITQLESTQTSMREAMEIALREVQLRVKRRVYLPLEVQIGAHKFKSKREMESGIISLVDDDVCFQPGHLGSSD
ncbi:MAG: DUF342 domain-containing protein [Gammaproteobacteria bacterium]|nr:DUF342 domain-containing protein [Gammaproteobacteria bacterium]MBQ0839318.1 DUF342 domain-containing protein [Gammaproteobacteria bacterium]